MIKSRLLPIKPYYKFLSILVVAILLFTSFVPAVNSIQPDIKMGKANGDSDTTPIGEKIKEKISDFVSKVRDKQDSKDESFRIDPPTKYPKNSFLSNIATLAEIKQASSTLFLHTNYGGKEKDTPLNLFTPTKVDVDDDGDDDIKANLLLYPSIELPLALCFNFRLSVTRLDGFNNKNAEFEVYVGMNFNGNLLSSLKDKHVKYGYQSEAGEEVPDSCIVNFKFLPHFFTKQKFETKYSIDPKSSVGKDRLTLLIDSNIAEMFVNNTLVNTIHQITYSPAVKSEVSTYGLDGLIGRRLKIETTDETEVSSYLTIESTNYSGGLGLYIKNFPKNFESEIKFTPLSEDTKFEYKKISTEPADVILYAKASAPQLPWKTFYGYIKYVPSHVVFSSKIFSKNGHISLDSFGESIQEIGVSDDLFDRTNYVYLSDLPTTGEMNWNFNFLDESEIKVYCDTAGLSLNLHTESKAEYGNQDYIVTDLYAKTYNNLDFTIFRDKSSGIALGLKRNDNLLDNVDIEFNFDSVPTDIYVKGTLGLKGSSDPFVIYRKGLSGEYDPDSNEYIVNSGFEFSTGVYLSIDKLNFTLNNFTYSGNLFHDISVDVEDLEFTVDTGPTSKGSFKLNCRFPETFDSGYLDIDSSSYTNLTVGKADIRILQELDCLPFANITSPARQETVSGTIQITGTATAGDPSRPIDFVQVGIQGEWYDVIGTTEWSYNLDTTKYDDSVSEFYLQVKCFDTQGFSYTSGDDAYGIYIDNYVDPKVEILTPTNGSTITEPVTIQVLPIAGDFEVDRVKIKIMPTDSLYGSLSPYLSDKWISFLDPTIKEFTLNETNSWSCTWDISDLKVSNDEYEIIAICIDEAQQENNTKVVVDVQKDPIYNRPTVKIDKPSYENPQRPIPDIPLFGINKLPIILSDDLVQFQGTASYGYSGRPVENVQIQFVPQIRSAIFSSSFNFTEQCPWINITDHTSDFSSWSYEWDTTDLFLDTGYYLINVRSYDGMYYSRVETTFVFIKKYDIFENTITLDVHRGPSSDIKINNFNLEWSIIDNEGTQRDVLLSFDEVTRSRDPSEDGSHLLLIYDKSINKFSINRTGGAEKEIQIKNLEFSFYDPNPTYLKTIGEFVGEEIESLDLYIKIDKIIVNKNREGLINVQWGRNPSVDFSFYASLYLSKDLELYGFYMQINDWSINKPDLHLIGETYVTFGLSIDVNNITWNIAEDFSWGWICIGNNGHVFIDVNTTIIHNGFEILVAGQFLFESGDGEFNFSWSGLDLERLTHGTVAEAMENFSYSISGSLLLSVDKCRVKFGELFDVRIDSLEIPVSGNTTKGKNFELTINETGGYFFFEQNQTKATQKVMDFDISLEFYDGQLTLPNGIVINAPNGLFPDVNFATDIYADRELNKQTHRKIELEWLGKPFKDITKPNISALEYVSLNIQNDIDSDVLLSIDNFLLEVNSPDYGYLSASWDSLTRSVNKSRSLDFGFTIDPSPLGIVSKVQFDLNNAKDFSMENVNLDVQSKTLGSAGLSWSSCSRAGEPTDAPLNFTFDLNLDLSSSDILSLYISKQGGPSHEIVINNLHAFVDVEHINDLIPQSPIDAIDLEISFNSLIFERGRLGSCQLDLNINQENNSFYGELYASSGLEIYGFYIRVGEWAFSKPEIHLVGEIYFSFGLDADFVDVTYNFADDLSWGWICIGSQGHITIDLNTTIALGNGFNIYISGLFVFESAEGAFNFSWSGLNLSAVNVDNTTIFENFKLDITGSLVIKVERCVIRIGDLYSVEVPEMESPDSTKGFNFSLQIDENGGNILCESYKFKDKQKSVIIDLSINIHNNTLTLPGGFNIHVPVAWEFNLEGLFYLEKQNIKDSYCKFELDWVGKILGETFFANLESVNIEIVTDIEREAQAKFVIEDFLFNFNSNNEDPLFEEIGEIGLINLEFDRFERSISKDNSLDINLSVLAPTITSEFYVYLEELNVTWNVNKGKNLLIEKLSFMIMGSFAQYDFVVGFNWTKYQRNREKSLDFKVNVSGLGLNFASDKMVDVFELKEGGTARLDAKFGNNGTFDLEGFGLLIQVSSKSKMNRELRSIKLDFTGRINRTIEKGFVLYAELFSTDPMVVGGGIVHFRDGHFSITDLDLSVTFIDKSDPSSIKQNYVRCKARSISIDKKGTWYFGFLIAEDGASYLSFSYTGETTLDVSDAYIFIYRSAPSGLLSNVSTAAYLDFWLHCERSISICAMIYGGGLSGGLFFTGKGEIKNAKLRIIADGFIAESAWGLIDDFVSFDKLNGKIDKVNNFIDRLNEFPCININLNLPALDTNQIGTLDIEFTLQRMSWTSYVRIFVYVQYSNTLQEIVQGNIEYYRIFADIKVAGSRNLDSLTMKMGAFKDYAYVELVDWDGSSSAELHLEAARDDMDFEAPSPTPNYALVEWSSSRQRNVDFEIKVLNNFEVFSNMVFKEVSGSTDFRLEADAMQKYIEASWSHDITFDRFIYRNSLGGKDFETMLENARNSSGDFRFEWEGSWLDLKPTYMKLWTPSGMERTFEKWAFKCNDVTVLSFRTGGIDLEPGSHLTVDEILYHEDTFDKFFNSEPPVQAHIYTDFSLSREVTFLDFLTIKTFGAIGNGDLLIYWDGDIQSIGYPVHDKIWLKELKIATDNGIYLSASLLTVEISGEEVISLADLQFDLDAVSYLRVYEIDWDKSFLNGNQADEARIEQFHVDTNFKGSLSLSLFSSLSFEANGEVYGDVKYEQSFYEEMNNNPNSRRLKELKISTDGGFYTDAGITITTDQREISLLGLDLDIGGGKYFALDQINWSNENTLPIEAHLYFNLAPHTITINTLGFSASINDLSGDLKYELDGAGSFKLSSDEGISGEIGFQAGNQNYVEFSGSVSPGAYLGASTDSAKGLNPGKHVYLHGSYYLNVFKLKTSGMSQTLCDLTLLDIDSAGEFGFGWQGTIKNKDISGFWCYSNGGQTSITALSGYKYGGIMEYDVTIADLSISSGSLFIFDRNSDVPSFVDGNVGKATQLYFDGDISLSNHITVDGVELCNLGISLTGDDFLIGYAGSSAHHIWFEGDAAFSASLGQVDFDIDVDGKLYIKSYKDGNEVGMEYTSEDSSSGDFTLSRGGEIIIDLDANVPSGETGFITASVNPGDVDEDQDIPPNYVEIHLDLPGCFDFQVFNLDCHACGGPLDFVFNSIDDWTKEGDCSGEIWWNYGAGNTLKIWRPWWLGGTGSNASLKASKSEDGPWEDYKLYVDANSVVHFKANIAEDDQNNAENTNYNIYGSTFADSYQYYTYEFVWGDGESLTVEDVTGTECQKSHAYSSSDVDGYTACVHIYLGDEHIASDTVTIVVGQLDVSIVPDSPVHIPFTKLYVDKAGENVGFTITVADMSNSNQQNSQTNENPTNFDNYALFDPSDHTFTYEINYGDGSSDVLTNQDYTTTVDHTFNSGGLKTITVVATNEQTNGAGEGFCKIQFLGGMNVQLTAIPINPDIDQTVTFTAKVTGKVSNNQDSSDENTHPQNFESINYAPSGGIYTYEFDFDGDGVIDQTLPNQGREVTISHSYPASDSYPAKVIVTKSGLIGRIGSDSITIGVGNSADVYLTNTGGDNFIDFGMVGPNEPINSKRVMIWKQTSQAIDWKFGSAPSFGSNWNSDPSQGSMDPTDLTSGFDISFTSPEKTNSASAQQAESSTTNDVNVNVNTYSANFDSMSTASFQTYGAYISGSSTGYTGSSYTFTAIASTGYVGDLSYSWDYPKSPITSDISVNNDELTLTFNQAGTYTISVSICDEDYTTVCVTDTHQITISEIGGGGSSGGGSSGDDSDDTSGGSSGEGSGVLPSPQPQTKYYDYEGLLSIKYRFEGESDYSHSAYIPVRMTVKQDNSANADATMPTEIGLAQTVDLVNIVDTIPKIYGTQDTSISVNANGEYAIEESGVLIQEGFTSTTQVINYLAGDGDGDSDDGGDGDTDTNSKPHIITYISNKNVDEGGQIQFTVKASDADGDELSFSSTHGNMGQSSQQNNYCSFAPGDQQDSEPQDIVYYQSTYTYNAPDNVDGDYSITETITVSDGQETDSESFVITIQDTSGSNPQPADLSSLYSTSYEDPVIQTSPELVHVTVRFNGSGTYVPTDLFDDSNDHAEGDEDDYTNTCFVAGTKILMADETYKNIEEVQSGDLVKSYDQQTKSIVNSHITDTEVNNLIDLDSYHLLLSLEYINNDFSDDILISDQIGNNNLEGTTFTLEVTPNHPMYVYSSAALNSAELVTLKVAGNLNIGDILCTNSGINAEVKSIQEVHEPAITYNIQVNNYHNYFANDVLVSDKQNDFASVVSDQDSSDNGGTAIDDDLIPMNAFEVSFGSYSLENTVYGPTNMHSTGGIIELLQRLIEKLENMPIITSILSRILESIQNPSDSSDGDSDGINTNPSDNDGSGSIDDGTQDDTIDQNDQPSGTDDDTNIGGNEDVGQNPSVGEEGDVTDIGSIINSDSPEDAVYFIWDYGDGTIDIGLNPEPHTYTIEKPENLDDLNNNVINYASFEPIGIPTSGDGIAIDDTNIIDIPINDDAIIDVTPDQVVIETRVFTSTLYIIDGAGNIIDIDTTTVSVTVPWTCESQDDDETPTDPPQAHYKNIENVTEGDTVISVSPQISSINDLNSNESYVPAQVTNVSIQGGFQEILIIHFSVDSTVSQTDDDNLVTLSSLSFDPIPTDGQITDPIDSGTGTEIQDPISDPTDNIQDESPIDDFIPDNKLQVAPDQTIFVNGALTKANQIQVGDKLTTIDGRQATVSSITASFQEVRTYDLSLDQHHVYFANGILVGDNSIVQGTDQNTGFAKGTKIAIVTGIDNYDSNKLANNQDYNNDLSNSDDPMISDDFVNSFSEFIVFEPF